jgi:hypothetical protein
MNATLSKPAPRILRWIEAVAKWRPALRIEIPVGYQDETGFHYGQKPAEKKITWPPVG